MRKVSRVWRHGIRLSEGKRCLALDIFAQAVLADRLGNDIDRTAENFLKSSGQVFEAAEIGKAALARLRREADDDIDIRAAFRIAARHGAENRQALDTGRPEVGFV